MHKPNKAEMGIFEVLGVSFTEALNYAMSTCSNTIMSKFEML